MQFAVPQFTEVEDRLIGSLTLKQFLVLLGTGGLVLFFWSILGPNIIFFILSLPISVFGVAAALGRYNGRPMFSYLMPFAAFITSSKYMVFKREPVTISMVKAEIKEVKQEPIKLEEMESADSRLKKLAYMLDQKTEEEEEIITSDHRNIIHATTLPKIDINQVMNRARADILAAAKKQAEKKVSSYSTRKNADTKPKKSKKFDPSDFIQT
jgi:hypothetical protein